jgi:hypothetical protein
MSRFWGADSLENMDHHEHGTTLADYVINTQYAGGTRDQIVWWGRYFDHGTSSGNDHWRGDVEADALSTAVGRYANPTGGNSWVMPIASPFPTPGPSSTYSTGVFDANYVGGIIAQNLSGRLHLPGNGQLMVYIDIENGQHVSTSYLLGWGSGINTYPIGSDSLPLYACAYVSPNDPTDVNNVNAAGKFFQAWTPEPEPLCSGCYSPGPNWAPSNIPGLPTNVWQYGEQPGCASCRGQTIYVDLDQTNPSIAGQFGYGQCDNMLYINP